MKTITKIGTGAIICGLAFSLVGGTIYALSPNKYKDIYLGENVSYEKSFDNSITELNLEVSFLNVEIKKGDKFKIDVKDVPEKLVPEIYSTESELSVTNESFSSKFPKLKDSNIQFGDISDDIVGTYTIYIPEKNLDEVEINSSFCSLDISELSSEEIIMECSFGEYDLEDIKCSMLDMDSSFSDTSLSDTKIKNIEITNSFGNIDAKKLKITEYGKIDNSFGDMEIKLSGDNYKFDISNSLGECNSFKCSKEEVEIEVSNSLGSINFTN